MLPFKVPQDQEVDDANFMTKSQSFKISNLDEQVLFSYHLTKTLTRR